MDGKYYCKMPENLRGVFNSGFARARSKNIVACQVIVYIAQMYVLSRDVIRKDVVVDVTMKIAVSLSAMSAKKVVCILNHTGEAVKRNYGYDEPLSYYCQECDPSTD